MTTLRFSREALADALERIAEHARKYKLTGLSVAYDGKMYRLVLEGEGELELESTSPDIAIDPP